MAVNVRAVSENDIAALTELNKFVQELHAAFYPGDFKQVTAPSTVREFFSAILAASMNAIAIAEADGVPVGYVWFAVQNQQETLFTLPRRRIYVHHISVAPDARRHGAAAALMRYVEQQAASEGIDEIALDAWSANLDARLFWASQGFVTLKEVLRKRLIRDR